MSSEEEFARILAGIQRPGRPDVGQLYSKLADLTATPVDLSPLKAVAAANREGSQRDFLGGMALSALGGKRLSRTGQDLAREGLERGKPLRPNAADVGYENVDTGEMVINPLTPHNQNIRSAETQIKGVEAATAREDATAARILANQQADQARRDSLEFRRMMGMGQLGLGNRRADAAAAAAAAKAAQPPKGQEPPAAIQTKLLGNTSNLQFIDTALTEGQANPKAFGAKTFLPEEILQRVDEKGVTARAFVQNIGSLKIHDRSGAAVTAAEFPRLKRFIPIAGEPWTVSKKKLEGMRTELDVMNRAIAAGWPTSALVNNLDRLRGGGPPPAPIAAGKRVEVSPGVFITEIPSQ